MTNSKTTRRALFASAIALLLCVVMLIGTTFAWFTDTASTSVNTIKSGTLDVDLQIQDENNEWVTAVGKTLTWQKAAAGKGQDVLWEPGAEYTLQPFKIVNNGNLSLKYKVEITGIDGDAELNEVITWTYSTANGDFNPAAEGKLEAGKATDPITIKGKMAETAGNEYQNKEITGVAITVIAAQDTVEYDSNGNTYDAAAEYATPVTSEAELTAAIAAGEDVVLKNDIALTAPLTVTAAGVTIDGNGHTLSGTVATGNSFISVTTDGDFTMTNLTVAPTGSVSPNPAINLNVGGKVTVTNCTFGTDTDTAGYMYNGLEFSQSKGLGDGSVISGNTFYGGAFRHNCISAYKFDDNATITISDNKFINLNSNTTNAMRFSNYDGNTVTINVTDTVYSIVTEGADTQWAGVVLFQNNKGSGAHTTINLTNLTVNGKVPTDNSTGTVDQVAVVYQTTDTTTPTIKLNGTTIIPYTY